MSFVIISHQTSSRGNYAVDQRVDQEDDDQEEYLLIQLLFEGGIIGLTIVGFFCEGITGDYFGRGTFDGSTFQVIFEKGTLQVIFGGLGGGEGGIIGTIIEGRFERKGRGF
ncbi:MAG: hypothetical protein EZS28_002843 [Streblomastix strix]|uniref:Uncharacterized protein n=1 Tax=Streblomastix strix TaxID=222440 RepID=A0A5J4X304_9EUKA|nr:MAG: hypothetical protein EZS28_002843 [Streblomastix strix]